VELWFLGVDDGEGNDTRDDQFQHLFGRVRASPANSECETDFSVDAVVLRPN
jgi:hypothetical protein